MEHGKKYGTKFGIEKITAKFDDPKNRDLSAAREIVVRAQINCINLENKYNGDVPDWVKRAKRII